MKQEHIDAGSSTLIVQISDCHLPGDSLKTYRGINPHQNLQALVQKVRALGPDMLLATGDLSEDGSRKSYEALQEVLNPLGVPILALPGNHDVPDLLAKFFPGSPVDSIAVSSVGLWRIIRLNTCLPGKPEGRLAEKALRDLGGYLEDNEMSPTLISLHHQPVTINSPWIDKYRLMDSEGLLQLIDRYRNVKAIVWGHVHQVYESERSGTAMMSGPSSAINGVPGAQRFTPDSLGPSCRWLKLKTDGSLSTGIVCA